jgi:hypothetical protein
MIKMILMLIKIAINIIFCKNICIYIHSLSFTSTPAVECNFPSSQGNFHAMVNKFHLQSQENLIKKRYNMKGGRERDFRWNF